ncbi:MAG: GerMN domain-containing protein [Clostridiales bacterium]|nr:GerMN domain-containing protein [Clostridiales bacterium]
MKKIVWICITALLLSVFAGCVRTGRTPEGLIKKETDKSADEEEFSSSLMQENSQDVKADDSSVAQQSISLYFWNKENNRLVCESRNIMTLESNLSIDEIVMALIKGPESDDLQPVIPRDTRIINTDQSDNIVTVNLSEEFLKAEDLLVAYTALTNTLTERADVQFVKININGKELTGDGTPEGEPLGVLSRSTNNIDELLAEKNRQKEQDTIKEVNRELFFRDFRGRYLLSEVRTIKVKNKGIVRAIVEELIKGPVEQSEGLYSVIPQGTKLLETNLLDGDEEDSKVVALYFSKEIKSPFEGDEVSRGDKNRGFQEIQDEDGQNRDKEAIILSSIVYSLSDLNNVKGVKIFYEDKNGNYTDAPIYSVDLRKPLTTKDFPNKLGKKIKIYFANENATHLIADYRAMSRGNVQVAKTIIDELIGGPRANTEHKGVFPADISKGDIRVWMDEGGSRVMVDLPTKLDGNKMGSTGALMALYAVVNSLTDPVNTSNVKEVKFLVDGQNVKTFGNLEFSEPFIRNPAIIKE